MYDSEIWTLNKKDEICIHAFDIWICRRMFRIICTQRKANSSGYGKRRSAMFLLEEKAG